MSFKVNEGLLAHILFLLIGKKIDHPREAWRNGLLQLGRHQNAYGREGDHLGLGKILWADHIDISVEKAGSYKESFLLVIFFLVEVEDFLDTVGAIIR